MNIHLFERSQNPKTLRLIVYVLHVKVGYEERAIAIEKQLKELGISFDYVLEWDKSELSENHLNSYFAEEMRTISSASSCASKHIEAWKKFASSSYDLALVLEDDIRLDKRFTEYLKLFLEEYSSNPTISESTAFISLENSGLKFVPAPVQNEGQYLYPINDTRCAGAYLLNQVAARFLLQTLESRKMNEPVDWWLKRLSEEQLLSVYWSHPTIAEQGSHNGQYASSIDHKKAGSFRRLSWMLQRFYKHTRNRFR